MTEELQIYFNGDSLAANVWASKYAKEGETIPDDMHKRLAKEFAKIEKSYTRASTNENDSEFYLKTLYSQDLSNYGKTREDLTEASIYQLFKDFKYIVPQGSIMYGLGIKDKYISLSNCFFVGQPHDSYSGIMQKDQELVQLMKRRKQPTAS